MKIKTIIAVTLASVAIAACAQNSESPELKALQPTKGQIDSVSYLMGVQFAATAQGWGFGKDFNYNEVVKGFKDFFNAEGNPQSVEFMDQFKISPELMSEIFTDYIQKIGEYEGAKGAAEGEAFLAENKLKDGVAVTASGLQYIIEEKGNDVVPKPEDTVEVYYKGTLLDGTVFDETHDDTVSFPLNAVIPGWTEGIQLIGEGGKIRLFIPSNLAYGPSGAGGVIGPNATLIFDVELVKVIPNEVPEEE